MLTINENSNVGLLWHPPLTRRLGLILYSLSLSAAATVEISQVDIGSGVTAFTGQTLAPGDILYYQIDPSPNGYSDSELVFRTLGGFLSKITFLSAASADGAPATGNFAIPSCQSGHYLVSISDSQTGVTSGDTPELAVILGSNNGASVPPQAATTATNDIPGPTSSNDNSVPPQGPTATTATNAIPGPTSSSDVAVPPQNITPTASKNNGITSSAIAGSSAPATVTDSQATTDLRESTEIQGNNVPHETNGFPNNSGSPLPTPEITSPPSDTDKKSLRKKLVGIIAGSLALLIIVIITISACLLRRKRSRQNTSANSNASVITRLRKFSAPRPTEIAHPYDSTPSTTPVLNASQRKENPFLPMTLPGAAPHNQVKTLTEVIVQLQDRIRRIEETSDLASTPTGRNTTYMSSSSRGTDEPPPTYYES